MRVLTAAVLLLGVTACGDRPARTAAGGAPADAGTAANPTRPWETPLEPGLWRNAVISAAGAAPTTLTCYAQPQRMTAGASPAGTACGGWSHELTREGFTRQRRCGEGAARVTQRETVTGDLASGFSVAAEGGAVTTRLRLGPCPDGWRNGETRPEVAQAQPPRTPTTRPPAVRPPGANGGPLLIPTPPEIAPPPLPGVEPAAPLGEPVEPTPAEETAKPPE